MTFQNNTGSIGVNAYLKEELKVKTLKVLSIGTLAIFVTAMLAYAGHVNVPASAFRSQNEDASVILYGYRGAVYYASGQSGYLVAPVNLPDGVYIKNIRAVYYDNDASYNLTVHLVRQNVFLDDHTHLFSVSSSGASASVQSGVDSTHSTSASDRLVQNGPVQWYIEANFPYGTSNLRLHHVSIEYQ